MKRIDGTSGSLGKWAHSHVSNNHGHTPQRTVSRAGSTTWDDRGRFAPTPLHHARSQTSNSSPTWSPRGVNPHVAPRTRRSHADLQTARRPLENPIAHPLCRHVRRVLRTRPIGTCRTRRTHGTWAEGNERAMGMRRTGVVVACSCPIAPNRVTALSAVRSCTVMLNRRTLTHRLALPAQLQNNCCRSLREKKRSRTGLRVRHCVRHERRLAQTISARGIHFDRVPHLAREERGHGLGLCTWRIP